MNQPDRSDAAGDHASRCLLTDLFGRDDIDQSKPLSVQGHHQFRESIAGRDERFDDIDLELDAMHEAGPWDVNIPSRRKESEVSKLLDLLANLPRGKDSE